MLLASTYITSYHYQIDMYRCVAGKAVDGSGQNQLLGHVIMLPLKKKRLKQAQTELPRKEIAKWISVTWTGDDASWKTVQTMAEFTDMFTLLSIIHK